MIREKLLEHLPQEVPYNVQQVQAQRGDLGALHQVYTQSRTAGSWREKGVGLPD